MASIFKNIWNTGKKAVKDVGHFVGKVGSNPLVLGGLSLIPGVGIPTAAAIGGISGLIKPGGNIGQGLKGAATGAAAGAAGKAISKIPGVGSTIGKIPGIKDIGNFIGGIPGLGAVGSALGQIPGVSSLERFLGGGGAGGGGPDYGDILKTAGLLGLGGAQALNAANLGKQSTEYAKNALDSVKQSYGERGLLRAAGVGGMLNPQTADLSGLLSHGGPYATGLLPKMPAKRAVASLGSYS
jgi:hypothetical protein